MEWTIEIVNKARAIYQAKYGGNYVENGDVFIRVLRALTEAAGQGAEKDDFCECGVSLEKHTGLYCSFRPATKDAPETLTDMPRPWSRD